MKSNLIIVDGMEVDISTLEDEELIELHKKVKAKEKRYKKNIQKYEEKYDFLISDEND